MDSTDYMCVYTNTDMHEIIIESVKEVMNLKESRAGYMTGFRGPRGREILSLKYNLKNKQRCIGTK